MNHSTAHAGNGRHVARNGPKRPASIAELAEMAMLDLWDDTKDFKHYLRMAEKYRKEGKECAKKGDLEGAFVELARAATLVLEKLPMHRDYNGMLNANQRQNLSLNGQDILDNLSDLKPALVDRYEKWLQKHPDGVEHEQTPNARTQKITHEDTAARAQAQREQFQAEERARYQAREQQRIAAEEAAKWRRQREQLQVQEDVESTRRKNAAAAAARQAATHSPDYTFSRPPNGHGSQSTVVLSDGRPPGEVNRQQQLQEQMRLREEEITKRQAEQKRKHEQEGISRRQREAEDAARAARQNLMPGPPTTIYPPDSTPSSGASVSPMFSNPSTSSAATTPSSNLYQPSPIEYPSISHLMPLENPSRYEGDSTDSESIHHHEFRHHKPPGRPTRSPLYPPPITTTSPIPGVGSIRYPTLMSQHQKSQGYFPSLNSMFIDTTDRYHGGSSVLFGSNANEGGYPAPYPGLPPSSAPIQPYSQQDSNTSYIRPPPLPPAAGNPPQSAPPIQTEAVRIPKPPDAIFDPNIPLKTVTLARECLPRFLAIAKVNTEMNKETCGLLLGKDKGHKYSVTTLLIPKQHSTSDTCTMDEEELVLQFTEERSLITLGWIHTHPSQSCFMSSVDLHTHSGFQRMLPESFAVVCAPKSNPNFGIFRLTDPPGLYTILQCKAKEAFHPHPDKPIYTDADKGHVQIKDYSLEIVDLR